MFVSGEEVRLLTLLFNLVCTCSEHTIPCAGELLLSSDQCRLAIPQKCAWYSINRLLLRL